MSAWVPLAYISTVGKRRLEEQVEVGPAQGHWCLLIERKVLFYSAARFRLGLRITRWLMAWEEPAARPSKVGNFQRNMRRD